MISKEDREREVAAELEAKEAREGEVAAELKAKAEEERAEK